MAMRYWFIVHCSEVKRKMPDFGASGLARIFSDWIGTLQLFDLRDA